MVSAYNKYAIKHGYQNSVIQVDYENKKVIGTFCPKDENTYHGFCGWLKNAVIAGHNASLQADYNKIVRAIKA